MADNLWKIRIDDKTYDLDARDLTVSRLRQFKAWCGKDYGAYLPFIQMMMQGDGDAVACAVWTVRTKAGEKNVPEPRYLDFAVADFFTVEPDEDEADPTPAEESEDEPTQG